MTRVCGLSDRICRHDSIPLPSGSRTAGHTRASSQRRRVVNPVSRDQQAMSPFGQQLRSGAGAVAYHSSTWRCRLARRRAMSHLSRPAAHALAETSSCASPPPWICPFASGTPAHLGRTGCPGPQLAGGSTARGQRVDRIEDEIGHELAESRWGALNGWIPFRLDVQTYVPPFGLRCVTPARSGQVRCVAHHTAEVHVFPVVLRWSSCELKQSLDRLTAVGAACVVVVSKSWSSIRSGGVWTSA
jgi:hypothetical protein